MREAVPDDNVHACNSPGDLPGDLPAIEAVNTHWAVIGERRLAARCAQPSYQETGPRKRVGPCGLFGKGACPRARVAKRVYVGIREKEGFTHPGLWRAPCFWGTYESKLHAVDT
jgi:hypothetical protein